MNGKFTVFTVSGTLIFCGTTKAVVVVFDLLKGSFVKQIPYQQKLFGTYFFKKERDAPSVVSVQANSSEQLLVTYSDRSFLVLDQPQKQVLAF